MNFLKRTWVEIDFDALKHNFTEIKKTVGSSSIMAVIKANAYGHGVAKIAPFYEVLGADWFAVSNIEEALELRQTGIKKPILILGYTPENMVDILADNNISQTIYSSEYAQALSKKARENDVNIKVHIKLDTGMGRIGFNCRSDAALPETSKVISNIFKNDNLFFEGLFTHYASADLDSDPNGIFTEEQYSRFCVLVDLLEKQGIKPEFSHCCNSAGLMLNSDKHCNMVRPGIILYGLAPSPGLEFIERFRPAMRFKTIVTMVKCLDKGDTVSYGRTYKAEQKIRAATLSVGYADGYPRQLSNKGRVIINGRYARIIGKVCMDQMVVDVSDIDDVEIGTEAVLFGSTGDLELPVEEISALCGTINYEIVCGISRRVPRIYKSAGKTVAVEDYLLNQSL